MRPTIPTFDPDHFETWGAWMKGDTSLPMQAAYASPGGFLAFEHVLAVKEAVDLHRTIGRNNIAARIVELNAQVREGLSKIPKVKLHTPKDAAVSAGLSAFEVAGLAASDVTHKLAAKKFRTSDSPYDPSYARVCAGIMNNPQEVDSVLAAIRAL
jgi:selenocysteine lyase/cysteine desulfurase